MHTRTSLARDLRALGVCAGDTLFVHSSFKSLGEVSGGVQSVVDALMDAMGDGLLLMPSFNLDGGRDWRAAHWDPQTTPSSVGWLTEFFSPAAGDGPVGPLLALGRRAGQGGEEHRGRPPP